MHLKAIDIKEKLLGNEDYEVALSLGHLASLYNYHMLNFRKAEQLYHRSIAIGKLAVFGVRHASLNVLCVVQVRSCLDKATRDWNTTTEDCYMCTMS